MSLKLNERYPGRFNNPSLEYPQGSFKNRTAPNAKDGSYLEQDWANDKEGFFQSLLFAVGLEPNGNVDKVGDSQFFNALLQARQNQSGTAFTTAGISPVLTLSPAPAIASYVANQRFRVKFSAASTGSDTLNISGKGVKSLKQYDSTGNKVSAVFALGQLSDVEYDGVDMVMLNAVSSIADATTSVKGKIQLATAAEAQALADGLKAITPASLASSFKGGNQALSANGFQKIPGGLVVQWVTTGSISSTPLALTFPTIFPTQALGVVGTNYLGATNVAPTQDALAFFGLTTSGVSARTNAGSIPSAKVIVIGY